MTSRRGTEVESRRASKEEELFESSFKTITEEVIGPEPRVVIPTRLVQEEAARSPTPPRSYSVEQMRREEKPKESPAKKSPGPKVYAYETPTKTLKGAPRVEEKKKPEPKPAHRDPNSAPTSPKKPTHSPVRQVVVHSQKEIYVESPTVSGSAHLSKQPLLPPLANQEEAERTLTIVFDLDETLCNNRRMGPAVLRPGAITVLRSLRDCLPSPVPGQSSRSETPQSASTRLYEQSKPKLRKRSTSLSFGSLETPGARLEIVLWTASVEIVARAVVQRLDPNGDIFDHLIYRDVRWYREASYAKDLRRLGRPLDNVVIVENAPASVALNRSNAVLVNDFVNNRNDRQLYVVRSILLEWLKRCDHSFRHIAYRGTPSEGRSPPSER
ncbi:hypothetical protein AGDE_15378 [Angomonas deanei]|uniref:Mitochondrial import inner membrane translocase subunit TIM50 n=1 Tax=Angomonas deanei TaxID=59799 RepID=A0A7G2CFP2_9TRYP|nr:hypothetical protein AGDE_15378 [Angomonas deanei]CAD2217781.1 NLI interacting factor-like phosphatase, putative [Angomonas deanei]|eukprot:EPY19185.1 hypothetical protein AGDE_15378 [Angomonas deanei]